MSKQVTDRVEDSTAMQRAFRNFGKLLRGRGVAAVLELLTVALLARELTPTPFGQLVLIQTYVLMVRGLFNFKLFEVLVRFGVPLLESGQNSSFKQLLQITILIDIVSSVVATVIAIAAAKTTGLVLGWDADIASLTMIYSGVLLSYGFGTAKGVLRIYDRYDVLGVQLMIGPVLRLAGVLLVMLIQPTLFLFMIALIIATAIGNVYLIGKGWSELRRQVGPIAWGRSALGDWRDQFSELPRFIVIVYWQGNVDMLPRHIATLLAGTFLGPAGAGLLRLAREATKILSKPGALLRQVLFPDMVRMWVRRSPEFRAILVRSVMISMLAGLALTSAAIFGGAYLLTAALGPDYGAAAPLLSLLLLATTLELVATILRSAGYAMGHAEAILKQNLFSSVLYLASFIVLTPLVGLIGPGYAACIATLIPLIGTGYLVNRDMRAQQTLLS